MPRVTPGARLGIVVLTLTALLGACSDDKTPPTTPAVQLQGPLRSPPRSVAATSSSAPTATTAMLRASTSTAC